MEVIGEIWNQIIIRPMINSLIVLYQVFFSNFGLSIIIFTVAIRGIMFPLTLKQSRQIKAMSALQPKIKEIQERYKNEKDKVSRETLSLYKKQGVNPLGCLGPLAIQFPIFIGLYQALRLTLPSTPERLTSLAEKLYSGLPLVHRAVPLDSNFLGMDLARVSSELGAAGMLLAFLVGGSMWAMQKMTATPAADPRQQSTTRMMLWMMPIMFGFFTLSFQAGLAVYWVISNIVGIAIQGFVTGWGPLESVLSFRRSEQPAAAEALVSPAKEVATDEDDRDNGQDARRSHRNRPKGARRRSRRSRNRRR